MTEPRTIWLVVDEVNEWYGPIAGEVIAAFDDKHDAEQLLVSLRGDGYEEHKNAVVTDVTIYPPGDTSLRVRSRWGMFWIVDFDGQLTHHEWPREQKYLADHDIASPADWTSNVTSVPGRGYRVSCYALTRDAAVDIAEHVTAGVVEKVRAGINPLKDTP